MRASLNYFVSERVSSNFDKNGCRCRVNSFAPRGQETIRRGWQAERPTTRPGFYLVFFFEEKIYNSNILKNLLRKGNSCEANQTKFSGGLHDESGIWRRTASGKLCACGIEGKSELVDEGRSQSLLN